MRTRLPFLMPLVAYLAAAIGFLAHSGHSRFGFPLDDSWIHRVYSRSFAFALPAAMYRSTDVFPTPSSAAMAL